MIRTPHQVKAWDHYIEVHGSFATNGVTTPDATRNKGKGFSVVRDNVGIYTVTLDATVREFIEGEAHLALHAPDGSSAHLGDVIVSASGVLTAVIHTKNAAGADADSASSTYNRVSFRLCCKTIGV